eukprot:8222712-Lingulodinium_polyedra.AAC.1
MEEGPDGFVLGRFGDEEPRETELPNLLLNATVADAAAVKVAPLNAPAVLKKPARATQPRPQREACQPYAKMYYAKANRMAIRRRHGGKK